MKGRTEKILAEAGGKNSPATKDLASRPWIDERVSAAQVTEDVLRPMDKWPGKLWILGLLLAMGCMVMMFGAIAYQFKDGIGILGINNPVGWGVYITNFVFWVGIGHAGTLISAVLLLFRQSWRNSINRTAEAMTIFAVMCAGVFPLIHTGRPWLAFWLIPFPNHRMLWVNFRSPLVWDVYVPTFWDWAVTLGSFGLFFTLFLLFIKLFPTISIAETKAILTRPFHSGEGKGTGS